MRRRLVLVCLVFAVFLNACVQTPPVYDLVIANGRVIDPETGFDAVANVGIRDGQIAEISTQTLYGHDRLEAAGKIVAPGFIDIHSHSPSPLGVRYQVLDGVTTQLDLEVGAYPVSTYGAMIAGRSPIHYGSSVSHLAVRAKVIEGANKPYLFTEDGPLQPGLAFIAPATEAQIAQMRTRLIAGLEAGGIGIGVPLDYISVAVSDAELDMIFEVAAEHDAPVTVHVRRGLPGDPAGLIEVVRRAEATGAALFICHITHSAMQAVPDWLAVIDAANARGARVTTETLSYAAGGTAISAAVFSRDWQSIFNISYGDVQWTATGEWLTEERWHHYRATEPEGMINHHYVKEDWIETALRWPDMMVSSDVTPALSEDVLTNPNLAGTFARLIGHYSRDRGVIDLHDALSRISLLQVRWLENSTLAFARKGRLQVGMDADIVVFDYDTIAARADYGDPYQPSKGIDYVVVAGVPVVRGGQRIEDAYPGQQVLAGETP